MKILKSVFCKWQQVPIRIKWGSPIFLLVLYAILLGVGNPIGRLLTFNHWLTRTLWILPIILCSVIGGIASKERDFNRIADVFWGLFTGTIIGLCFLLIFLIWVWIQVGRYL
jgi:hypothetical protein